MKQQQKRELEISKLNPLYPLPGAQLVEAQREKRAREKLWEKRFSRRASEEKQDDNQNWKLKRMKFKPDVGCVGRDVVLASGVKVLFGPFHRWLYSLVLSPQFPPLGIVVIVSDVSTEHLPSPLVDHVTKR